jgi:hypothetical protein
VATSSTTLLPSGNQDRGSPAGKLRRGGIPKSLDRSIRRDDVKPKFQWTAQEGSQVWCNGYEDWKCVRRAVEDDNRKRKLAEVLFVPQVFIHAENDVETGAGGTVKQHAVLERIPSHLTRRFHVMTRQEPPKAPGEIMVEQDPQS